MKSLFGILSLLVVVALVGFLAKRQLGTTATIKVPSVEVSAPSGPNDAASPSTPSPVVTTSNAQQQSLQIQQQVKAATEAALLQPRVPSEDKP